ncbi:LppU/SCO3897 family protein [Streptomyces sp. NPDC002853]
MLTRCPNPHHQRRHPHHDQAPHAPPAPAPRPCSASDAHYEVIQTIPMTSEMSRCNDNPKTQYAFSYRYTLNGSTINEHVYCLIGLGSYAR